MDRQKLGKLRLTFPTSFHICRPKKPNSMAKSPSPPVTVIFSPVSCKSCDISFPSFPYAPPSTPSESITHFESTSQEFAKPRYHAEKVLFDSPVSSESDETTLLITPPRKGKRNSACAGKKSRAMSISSYGSDEEDDSQFSSPTNFDPSYYHCKHPFMALPGKIKLAEQTSFRQQRVKHFNPKGRKHEDGQKKSSISNRLVPCMRDAKVKESFVVVKKSVDPYEDFKKSMMEMIVEKEIFEPKELENLLTSFLSLNSSTHHKVIIEAFTEIMRCVLC